MTQEQIIEMNEKSRSIHQRLRDEFPQGNGNNISVGLYNPNYNTPQNLYQNLS